MKTHEYFCNRFNHLEYLNQEQRFWESVKEDGWLTKERIKCLTNHITIDTFIESHGKEIHRAIRKILISLICAKFHTIREIGDEWSVHALRKYKQINGAVVIAVSVQSIERSGDDLSIRNIMGDPPLPYAPELVTYQKAYCVITRLRCPDGAIIFDKEIIDEICLEG